MPETVERSGAGWHDLQAGEKEVFCEGFRHVVVVALSVKHNVPRDWSERDVAEKK